MDEPAGIAGQRPALAAERFIIRYDTSTGTRVKAITTSTTTLTSGSF